MDAAAGAARAAMAVPRGNSGCGNVHFFFVCVCFVSCHSRPCLQKILWCLRQKKHTVNKKRGVA